MHRAFAEKLAIYVSPLRKFSDSFKSSLNSFKTAV